MHKYTCIDIELCDKCFALPCECKHTIQFKGQGEQNSFQNCTNQSPM